MERNGLRIEPTPSDDVINNLNHQAVNGEYTVSCLQKHPEVDHHTSAHQQSNSDYTISPRHSNDHQVPNGVYTISFSTPSTHHALHIPNGDYTISCSNSHSQPPSGDYTASSSNRCHENEVNTRTHFPLTGYTSILQQPLQPCGFLLACNPVNIKDSVLEDIRRMVHETWPDVTDSARRVAPMFAKTYDAVKQLNVPNFAGARIPVASGLNVPNWALVLKDYHDNEICHFLQFGWPLGYYSNNIPQSVEKNHPSALAYSDHIDAFIETELGFQAMEGPFGDVPFSPWFRISPLMTRPKKGSSKRRVIVDLSYPDGLAVNTGINIQDYLGRDISYSLPTVADLVSKLKMEGKGAYVWKADLARAYCQLRADPLDAPLLGINHKSIYVDRCPPFGCRSSSAACQRVANALVYSLASNSHHCLAYLDDFAGCDANLSRASAGFQAFLDLAAHLGLELSKEKCVQPTTEVEWLGYRINTTLMTISIPQSKLVEVLQECRQWLSRKRVTRNMVQSLAGRLSHVAGCVQHGRKFLTRILGALRGDPAKKWITVDSEFLKDVKWFHLYADAANGISLYSSNFPELVIECDSSLAGAGGNTDKFCYTWRYNVQHMERFPVIHQMEAVNILVAYRTLAHVHNQDPIRVLILTDNISSSAALMTGRTKDVVLGACARELWLEAAKNDDIFQSNIDPELPYLWPMPSVVWHPIKPKQNMSMKRWPLITSYL